MKKLRLTSNTEKGKSTHIEKIGIKIELFLLQIEFSDLMTSRSDISFSKKMKLGGKNFEIHNTSLYTKKM